ncbi:MAG: M3 family oligoendopeptidase [Deltaproteobacteria bacterium]|nr:M3 family oligoendopeptidase [Deltaproteobacteria bacterium]
MEMRWNLDSLYESFESDSFRNDLKKFDDIISEINEWSEKSLADTNEIDKKIGWWINKSNDLGHLSQRLGAFAHLNFSVNAKNSTAKKHKESLNVKLTCLTKAETMFIKWLASIDDLEDIIGKSELLKKYSFYLNDLVRKSNYFLDEDVEVAIAKMRNTGSSAWNQLWNVLSSNLLVEVETDGEVKKLPLPVVRNMAYDKDGVKRKTGYEAELKAYESIDEAAATSLNGIKGEVLTLCGLKGYNSPLEKTLIDSRMDWETLDAMLEAMKESFPVFRKYLKKKGELLGHNNGIPFYELYAPMGKSDMTFTYEEARDFVVSNFRNFSDELADFADNAFANNWIDAEPREGKRGGAFCSNLHVIGESRILSNFTGTYSGVVTLAHELGHAYHGFCLKNESCLNSRYPMPLAETASIFCETIIANAVLKEAGKDETLTILAGTLSKATGVIVDIYSRYLFETELFEKRKDSSLSVEDLKEAMISGQKGSYGDGLDPDFLHPYMWICKPHYYFPNRDFYNFPYAFGLLFAKGLYAEYLKKGDGFVGLYKNLLKATGSNSIADVAKLLGIDVRSKEFWKSSLDMVAGDIEKFIELSE